MKKVFRSLFACCLPPQDQSGEFSQITKDKTKRLLLPETSASNEEEKSISKSYAA
jgi:rhamnogalacturonyl hydrolase YesR